MEEEDHDQMANAAEQVTLSTPFCQEVLDPRIIYPQDITNTTSNTSSNGSHNSSNSENLICFVIFLCRLIRVIMMGTLINVLIDPVNNVKFGLLNEK